MSTNFRKTKKIGLKNGQLFERDSTTSLNVQFKTAFYGFPEDLKYIHGMKILFNAFCKI